MRNTVKKPQLMRLSVKKTGRVLIIVLIAEKLLIQDLISAQNAEKNSLTDFMDGFFPQVQLPFYKRWFGQLFYGVIKCLGGKKFMQITYKKDTAEE